MCTRKIRNWKEKQRCKISTCSKVIKKQVIGADDMSYYVTEVATVCGEICDLVCPHIQEILRRVIII